MLSKIAPTIAKEWQAALEVDRERAEKAAALKRRDDLQARLQKLKVHNALLKLKFAKEPMSKAAHKQ